MQRHDEGPRKRGRHTFRALAILTALAISAGCSSTSKTRTATTIRPEVSTSSFPQSSSTSEIAPTTSTTIAHPLGTVLFDASEVCGKSPNGLANSIESSIVADGPVAAIECTDFNGKPLSIVTVDLYNPVNVSTFDLAKDTFPSLSSRFLYTVSAQSSGGDALNSPSVSTILSQYDYGSQTPNWSTPIGKSISQEDPVELDSLDCGSVAITESPKSKLAHSNDIYVLCRDDSFLLDGTSGKLVENYGAKHMGIYLGYGIFGQEADKTSGESDQLTGIDARDLSTLWTIDLGDIDRSDSGTPRTTIGSNGDVLFTHDYGAALVNVTTGKIVFSSPIPEDWEASLGFGVFVGPKFTVYANDSDGTLELFSSSDLSDSIWSVPANAASIRAVTHGHIVVGSKGHLIFISTKDGRASADIVGDDPASGTEIDGILLFGTRFIVADESR